MPWFVTPHLRFLHVPKTGGTWATDAMCASGVPAIHPDPSPAHATLQQSLEYDDRFTLAFIRHPLDYWRSYWAYRIRTGWDADSQLDRDACSDDFEEFIERVIAFAPGAASALFEQFVGPPDDEIAFVGRHERLVDDVCLALRIAGETFDEQLLRSYPRVNVSDYSRRGARYPRSLAQRLVDAESQGIERFYSWEPIPARLLIGGRPPSQAPRAGRDLAELTIQLRDTRAVLHQTRRSLHASELARHGAERELAQMAGGRPRVVLRRAARALRREVRD